MRNTVFLSTATAALLLFAGPSMGQAPMQAPDQQNQQGGQSQQPPASRSETNRQAQPEASRPFTRVPIRTAADLTGRPLLDAAGGVVGEIEYLLIDTGSAKVRFAIVGRGGVLDLGEELIAVPWSHLRVNGGMPPRIDLYMEDLEGAPRLSGSTLRELTEPNFVTRVTNYFAPIAGGQAGAGQPSLGDRSSGPQAGSQFQRQAGQMAPGSSGQQMTQESSEASASRQQLAQEMQNRQGAGRGQGTPSGRQAGQQAIPMTPDGMQTMLSDQSIGSPAQQRDSGQQMSQQSGQAQQPGGQQQSGSGQAQPPMSGGQDAQSSSARAQQQQQRQAEGSAAQGSGQQAQGQRGQRQAQRSQGQQAPAGFILVGRSIVTTLAPPAFKFASGLRGAEVVAQDGTEIGEVAQVMIDVERGRVAYVTIAQGGFLGLGEALKPVPLQALDWAAPETLRLQVPKAALDRMPNLTGDVPTAVRRSDLEKLYQHFGITPYWQQT